MPKRSNLDYRDWRVWLFIALIIVVGSQLPGRISVTLTPSLKHRVYWLAREPDRVKRGDYVLFHYPERVTRLARGEVSDLMKILGCDEGDILTVDGTKNYYCNGEYLVRAKDVSLNGERIENFKFNGPIPAGFMFVVGQHKDSYDSRYFGLVEKNRIRAKAYPIF